MLFRRLLIPSIACLAAIGLCGQQIHAQTGGSLEVVPGTAMMSSSNDVLDIGADGYYEFNPVSDGEHHSGAQIANASSSALSYTLAYGTGRAETVQGSGSIKTDGVYVNHTSAAQIHTRTYNDAFVWAASATGTSAQYEVQRLPSVDPDAPLIYRGMLSVGDQIDDRCYGQISVRSGNSWISYDHLDAEPRIESLQSFIDSNGQQRYLAQYRVGAVGLAFEFAEFTGDGARVVVSDLVDYAAYTFSMDGGQQTGEVIQASSTCTGRVELYLNPDDANGGTLNTDTVVEPTFVQFVSDTPFGPGEFDFESLIAAAGGDDGSGDGGSGDGGSGDGGSGDGGSGGDDGYGDDGYGDDGYGDDGYGDDGYGDDGSGDDGYGDDGYGDDGYGDDGYGDDGYGDDGY